MAILYGQNQKSTHLRDSFIQNLCDLCLMRQIEPPKQGQSTFMSAQEILTEGSLMACQALVEYVNTQFEKLDSDTPPPKLSKQLSQTYMHEQDLSMWQCILETILKIDSALTYIDKQSSQ